MQQQLHLFPPTPSTSGRSRFSKALPTTPARGPPRSSTSTAKQTGYTPYTGTSGGGEIASGSSVTASGSSKSPQESSLPPIPRDPPLPTDKMLPAISISRRPVPTVTEKAVASKEAAESVKSRASSTYSDAPGLSRSLSGSSAGNNAEHSPSGLYDYYADVLDITDPIDETPALPPKDEVEYKPAPTPSSPEQTSRVADVNGLPKTPPRPEIWRRRSRSIQGDFPPLKLETSNGSTASSPPSQNNQTAVPAPGERSLPPPPAAPFKFPPRSLASLGAPNSNRKPVPVRPAPPQPEVMGNKLSKPREKTAKVGLPSQVRPVRNGEAAQKSLPPPPGARPPTPEYSKTDKEQPMLPPIMSPISPASPPNDALQIPHKLMTRRKPAPGAVPTVIAAPTPPSISPMGANEEGMYENNDLLALYQTDTNEASTKTPDPILSPTPSTTRKPVAASKPALLEPSPPLALPRTTPLQVNRREQSSSEPLSAAAAAAAYFPTWPQPTAPPDAVLSCQPPGPVQFNCFHSHRQLRRLRNTVCPLACMVCQQNSPGSIWNCTWCCLRCCEGCQRNLAKIPGRDLKVLLAGAKS